MIHRHLRGISFGPDHKSDPRPGTTHLAQCLYVNDCLSDTGNRLRQWECTPDGNHDMLKSLGKPALLLKLGELRCMCVRSKFLDDALKARIRPLAFFGLACWCDRPDQH